MGLVYDDRSGYVIDDETGEVVDQVYMATLVDGFGCSRNSDLADRVHYARYSEPLSLPRSVYEAFKIALTFLRTRFGNRVDYSELAKIVSRAFAEAPARRGRVFVAAAVSVYIYAAKNFSAHVDPEELCVELSGSTAACDDVGRVMVRLSAVFKCDRKRVIYSIIDSVASGELAYVAKLLVGKANISGFSSKVVAGAAVYIAGLITDMYTPLERISKKLSTKPIVISRLVNSGRIAKIFRSRAGAPITVEVGKEVCREVEKVAKLSSIVRCV